MEEKLIADFKSLGCKSDKEAAVAVQVYLELCEVKKLWNVQYFYDSLSESMYFTAKQTKSSKEDVFIPVHTSQELSFNILHRYLHLSNKHDSNVILVFMESNSTCVFYQFSDGLGDLNSSSSRSGVESKRQKLDAEMIKMSPVIQESALCGLPLPVVTNKSGST